MFKSLIVSNFASHKGMIKIDFHKNITVITGNSDSGKSALFYALYLLIHNKPLNPKEKFANNRLKDFKIKLILNNNTSIIRKNKEYILSTNEETQAFKAFKTSIPEPIENILQLKPVNWQMDYDGHFLIMENGGTIAKTLAKSLGTEDQNKLIVEIKKDLSQNWAEIKYQQKVIKENKEILDRYQGINKAHEQAQSLKIKQEEIINLNTKIDNIKNLLNNIKNLQERKLSNAIKDKLINTIKVLNKNTNQYKEKKLKLSQLEKIINILQNLTKLSKTEIKFLIVIINSLKNCSDKIQVLRQEQKELERAIKNIELLQEKRKTLNLEIKQDENHIKEFWKKTKICPTCGGEINENNKYFRCSHFGKESNS